MDSRFWLVSIEGIFTAATNIEVNEVLPTAHNDEQQKSKCERQSDLEARMLS